MPADTPAEEIFSTIAEALRREDDVEDGTGFGKTPGLRVSGRIFAMLMYGELVLKLPAARSAELVERGEARTFAVGKRRMREWVSVPPERSRQWPGLAGEALRFVRG